MEELDGFRYRARDTWRSVTKIAVREARLKEIKQVQSDIMTVAVFLRFPLACLQDRERH